MEETFYSAIVVQQMQTERSLFYSISCDMLLADVGMIRYTTRRPWSQSARHR